MIETRSPDSSRAPRGQRGFTLIEVTVSLIVTVIVLLGVLALFDFSNKLTRVQTNISDMQQSLRVAQTDSVRLIRMAGRGGLPVGNLPDGYGGGGRQQRGGRHPLPSATPRTPEIVHGSDVLTVRGVFSTPIYQIDSDRQRRGVHPHPRRPRRRAARCTSSATHADRDPAGPDGDQGRDRQAAAGGPDPGQRAGLRRLGRGRARPGELERLEPGRHHHRLQDHGRTHTSDY